MSVNSDIEKILTLDFESSSARTKAKEKLNELAKRIKQGESTGDKIKDFSIVHFESLNSKYEQKCRSLEEKLKNQVGKQVLIVRQKEDIHGSLGIVAPAYIRPEFIGVDTFLGLGVLTSNVEFNIKEGLIILPMEKYVHKKEHYRSKWGVAKGPTQINWTHMLYFGKEIPIRTEALPNVSGLFEQFKQSLNIFAGNEVEKYFKKSNSLDHSYLSALKLLGLKAPEKVQKQYDEEINKKKLSLINTFQELALGSKEFSKYQIERCLEEALELEMNKQDKKIELKPWLELNLPKYISELCKKYGFKEN